MIKRIFITTFFGLALIGTATAETYWLNIYGSYSQKHKEFTPSVSMPLVDNKECQVALDQFSKDNEMVEKISCDLKPLSGAINLADQWAGHFN